MATLSREEYWDKVYACWLGKNCGGTLGAPLEKAFAQEELFDIVWYPELREGGIPNDDLELQLIWLKAVEEQGFDITAKDLAQYWLDYVGYNWDEYGMHKTSLRLGLKPPVSGYYNNWFRDCMGSPIRSEIWACLAPGVPELAAKYAYEDAIVDHAGGESVWGEMFNATLQSAAFVESNPQKLLDIGLSYIPATSITARAVQAARAAHRAGVDWKTARAWVVAVSPNYVAQYSPLNLGFQTIGWLYGADFGDALCTAVNCGYDTDCTGATLGALLGILGGRAGLPARWTEPLGDAISTNESWGGLRNTSTTSNPVPANLGDLTDRTCAQGQRLLAVRDAAVKIGDTTNLSDLEASHLFAAAVPAYATVSPLALTYELDALSVEIAYDASPAVAPGTPRIVWATLRNARNDALELEVHLKAPDGWHVEPAGSRRLDVAVGGTAAIDYMLAVSDPARVHNSNRAMLQVTPVGRPAEAAIPVVLAGARRWLLQGPLPFESVSPVAALDHLYVAEQPVADRLSPAIAEGWQIAASLENSLPLSESWVGVQYARLFLHSAMEREVRLGIPATCPRKIWLNGEMVHAVPQGSLLRPNYGGDGESYVDTHLREGWNEVLIKYVREAGSPAFAAHFILATTVIYHGIHDVEWTALPWEVGDKT